MKINILEKALGSGLFTGYIPFASGTFGSLAALMIYLIPGFENPVVIFPMIVIFFFVGLKIGTKFETIYGKDPSECTIDEFVGTWIALLFVPKLPLYIIITFVIWRFFDIIKVYPANKVESIKGGLGIMLDDVVAGIYALGTVHVVIYFINYFKLYY